MFLSFNNLDLNDIIFTFDQRPSPRFTLIRSVHYSRKVRLVDQGWAVITKDVFTLYVWRSTETWVRQDKDSAWRMRVRGTKVWRGFVLPAQSPPGWTDAHPGRC